MRPCRKWLVWLEWKVWWDWAAAGTWNEGGVAHGFRKYSRAIEISDVSWGEKKGCVFRVNWLGEQRKVDTHVWYLYSIKPSHRKALTSLCLSQYTASKWLRPIASGPILTSRGLWNAIQGEMLGRKLEMNFTCWPFCYSQPFESH